MVPASPRVQLLLAWVAGASLLALVLAIVDKSAARRQRSRVPEVWLLGIALAGGSPGLLVGMLLARHKTRKLSFLAAFTLVVALQVAAAWLWLR